MTKAIITPYEFYIDSFNKKSSTNDKNDLITEHLLKLSKYFTIQTKDNSIESIIYKGKYKIDPHYDNYLFKFFMKNHFYLSEYLNKYENIESINITKGEIKDFILTKFYTCLQKNSINKKENEHLKNKSDYDIISSICVKERLTYYNYLLDNDIKSKEQIKKYLNKKYIEIILNSSRDPIIDNRKVNLTDVFEAYSKERKGI